MAKYGINFGSLADDALLTANGFTSRWAALTGSSLLVKTEAASIDGGKVARFDTTGDTTKRRAVSWDAVGTPEFAKLFARIRPGSDSLDCHVLHIFGAGSEGNETGLFLQLTNQRCRLDRYSNGSLTTQISNQVTPGGTETDFFNILWDFSADPITVKVWLGDVYTDEPGTSTLSITRTEAGIAGPGWVSLQAAFGDKIIDYDFLGLATGVDEAPRQMSDVSGGTAVDTALKLTLNDEAGDPIPNLSGLRYVVTTARTPDQISDANIVSQGNDGTTDASGVFTVASGQDNVGDVFGVAITTATATTGGEDNHRGTWRVAAAEEV